MPSDSVPTGQFIFDNNLTVCHNGSVVNRNASSLSYASSLPSDCSQVCRGDYVLLDASLMVNFDYYPASMLLWYPQGFFELAVYSSPDADSFVSDPTSIGDMVAEGYKGWVSSEDSFYSPIRVSRSSVVKDAVAEGIFDALVADGMYPSGYFDGKDGVFIDFLAVDENDYVNSMEHMYAVFGGIWLRVKDNAPVSTASNYNPNSLFSGVEMVPNSMATALHPERSAKSIGNIAMNYNGEKLTSEHYNLEFYNLDNLPSLIVMDQFV